MTQDEAIIECKARYDQKCKELWDAAEGFVRAFNFPTAASIIGGLDGGMYVRWEQDGKSCLIDVWIDNDGIMTATSALHRGNDDRMTNESELSKVDYTALRDWMGFA